VLIVLLVTTLSGAVLFLVSWRIARRFGLAGCAAFIAGVGGRPLLS
jgi:hypothetical protein